MLKDIDQKYYCSNYYDAIVNTFGVKYETLLRIWENKGWIHSIDSYGWFQWYFIYWLGRRSVDDKRQIARWKKVVTRFKGKLVELSKMLIVDMMIILFHLKLDRFYRIGDVN